LSEIKGIELKKITKIYDMGETKVVALKDIDLTVQEGEMTAIMGASGSGKSTLLNILGCLDKPTEGSYYLDGEDVALLSRNELAGIRNRRIGFVFQSFNLLNRVSVLKNVQLPMIYARVSKEDMVASAKEALAWVGMSKYLYHRPSQMSGGQCQRIAIARALVNNPSIILADEPTGALDSRTGIEIISVMQRLNIEKDIIVLMVTHDIDVSLYCKRVVTLKDGHILNDAPVAEPRNAAQDLAALPEEKEAEM
jgi:putative ABC transport system ATP-binding protein